jgi:ATP-dependent 26S proteasome regulatory subunit
MRRRDDEDSLSEQELQLERLREQLATLASSTSGGRGRRARSSNGAGDTNINYVVERRRASRLEMDDLAPPKDPDVWSPPGRRGHTPNKQQQQQQQHPQPQQEPPPPASWPSPPPPTTNLAPPPPALPPFCPWPPGSVGPTGRRPAVLSRPGGGVVVYPGGGGPGGGAASGGSAAAVAFSIPLAAPAASRPPPPPQQQHHNHHHHQHHVPSSLSSSSVLPPPHQHHHHHEDAALLAALERDLAWGAGGGGGGGGALPTPLPSPSSSAAPTTRWEDVAGLRAAKALLQEAAVLPLLCPSLFTGIRRPPKGVLLHGPPGTGKTMLARAVASEAAASAGMAGGGCAFFSASAATLASKYRGESERMVRLLFSVARQRAPSVVFLDEVDALCGQRGGDGEHEASRRFKAELLVQIDACAEWAERQQQHSQEQQRQEQHEPPRLHNNNNRPSHHRQQPPLPPPPPPPPPPAAAPRHVLVLAATNHPWDLDDALRRRLEKRVYVPLPRPSERRELLELCLRGVEARLSPADLDALSAAPLQGYSSDDVRSVCREAAMAGLRRRVAGKSPAEVRAMMVGGATAGSAAAAGGAAGAVAAAAAAAPPVTRRDFDEAISRVRPSVTASDAARHDAWSREFGSA